MLGGIVIDQFIGKDQLLMSIYLAVAATGTYVSSSACPAEITGSRTQHTINSPYAVLYSLQHIAWVYMEN